MQWDTVNHLKKNELPIHTTYKSQKMLNEQTLIQQGCHVWTHLYEILKEAELIYHGKITIVVASVFGGKEWVREFSGVLIILCILRGFWVMQVYIFVRIYTLV